MCILHTIRPTALIASVFSLSWLLACHGTSSISDADAGESDGEGVTSEASATSASTDTGTGSTTIASTSSDTGTGNNTDSDTSTQTETESSNDTEAVVYPSDLLADLVHWKITLPIDKNGDDSSSADNVDDRNTNAHEILDLVDVEFPPWFYVDVDGGEVMFRAHAAGATTSGSKYPRSELRQLVGGGDNYWSVHDYQHLETELRITHLTEEKPEVSVVQIHGPSDEPLRVQVHRDIGVYIIWNEVNKDKDNALEYALGEQLRIAVTVENGEITTKITNIDRDTSYSKTWESTDSQGYFKVDCYTQSSFFLSEFKDGFEDELPDAYAEVGVSSLVHVETY